MSEHVDMDRREQTLFRLDCDRRRDPWERATSLFAEWFRLGALPNGSGGRDEQGEPENTSVPGGLQLRLLCIGIGILGDMDGITEWVEHPLGTSMLWRSSSEQQSSEDREERFSKKQYCATLLTNVMKHMAAIGKSQPSPCFPFFFSLWAWPPCINKASHQNSASNRFSSGSCRF